MIDSLNLILKDFSKNDNLIKIFKKTDVDFEFYCSCGNQYCHHLDYVIHTISNDINNKIYEKCFQIIGFDNIEYIDISRIDEYNNVHNIFFNIRNNRFNLGCSCRNNNCFYSKYAIINIISCYLKKKEIMNNLENDKLLLGKIENELINMKI